MVFSKRGQGEQFNWIFIIVAGSILLAFFAVFTTKYIGLQELKQNVEIGRKFGQSINLLENSPVSGNGISIDADASDEAAFKIGMLADFEYFCDEESGKATAIFNSEDRSSQHLEREILFAPENMRMNALDLWVLPYNYPFFIDNFVFISKPGTDYFLVYDSNSESFVNELYVPGNLNSEKVKMGELSKKAEGGSAGTFVFFTQDKNAVAAQAKELGKIYDDVNVRHVKINRDSDVGEVGFFNAEGMETGRVKYYGIPLMWGAVFAGNTEIYNCNANKTLKRISAVSEIYSTRAGLLSNTEDQGCSEYYSQIKSLLSSYGKGFFTDGYKKRDDIEKENMDLAENKGCAYVF